MVGITRELKTDQGHSIDTLHRERGALRSLGDYQPDMWGSLLGKPLVL